MKQCAGVGLIHRKRCDTAHGAARNGAALLGNETSQRGAIAIKVVGGHVAAHTQARAHAHRAVVLHHKFVHTNLLQLKQRAGVGLVHGKGRDTAHRAAGNGATLLGDQTGQCGSVAIKVVSSHVATYAQILAHAYRAVIVDDKFFCPALLYIQQTARVGLVDIQRRNRPHCVATDNPTLAIQHTGEL